MSFWTWWSSEKSNLHDSEQWIWLQLSTVGGDVGNWIAGKRSPSSALKWLFDKYGEFGAAVRRPQVSQKWMPWTINNMTFQCNEFYWLFTAVFAVCHCKKLMRRSFSLVLSSSTQLQIWTSAANLGFSHLKISFVTIPRIPSLSVYLLYPNASCKGNSQSKSWHNSAPQNALDVAT